MNAFVGPRFLYPLIRIRLLIAISVAVPPLFLVAPAPDDEGPGADSASNLLGSAPAPQHWLQLFGALSCVLLFLYDTLLPGAARQRYIHPGGLLPPPQQTVGHIPLLL